MTLLRILTLAVLVISGSRADDFTDDLLAATRKGDLAPKTRRHPMRGGPYMPTPLAVGEFVVPGVEQRRGRGLPDRDGERVYQQRLSPNQGTALSASPVYADGKLNFPNEDGDVFVVKAGDKYELLSTNPMGEVLMATPAISDGTILIRGEHSVFAIREKAK